MKGHTRYLRSAGKTRYRRVLIAAAGLAALLNGNPATANDSSGPVVYGEVLRSDAIIEVVREPVNERVCYPSQPGGRSKTPLIAGGIIGGLIGHQFGSGRGQTAVTVAGTALGASLGADINRKRHQGCETRSAVRESERVTGYRVTYRYAGQIYQTETLTDPGERIRLRLQAAPS